MSARLSNLQFATLRFFSTHIVDQDQLRLYNMVIVLSLVRRGLLVRSGNIIEPSKEGNQVVEMFRHNEPSYRKYERPVSEMVGRLLHLRNLELMKAAS